MEDLYARFLVYQAILRRYRWIGMGAAWVVFLLGVAAVAIQRDKFEATARIYVDTQTVLKPLMTGLAFQPDVDQQVRMLAKTLITRPNIEQIMASPRVGYTHLEGREREKTIERLGKDIKITASGNTNLYEITFRDPNPNRAVRLVEDLVALFVSSGVGDKQRDSEQARQFLDEQIKAYEAKLSASENKLRDFKLRNFGLTGTNSQDYFSRINAFSQEQSKLRVDLRAAERARDAMRRELAGEDPSMPMESMPGGPQSVTSDIDARIEAQKKLLDDASRRYTDEHPDVVAAKRNIAMLEKERNEELRARRAATGASRVAPTSPVYQRIRIALAEAEAKVASLQGQLAEQDNQIASARAMAGRQPEVEAELAQLNRDYDIVRKNYEQLVSRRESASLGERIDETTKVAEFRVVEPPRLSPNPVKPSRLMVAMFTLLACVGVGLLLPVAIDQILPTVKDSKQLGELSGRAVLGNVSLVLSGEDAHKAQRTRKTLVTLSVALVGLNLAWIGAVMARLIP